MDEEERINPLTTLPSFPLVPVGWKGMCRQPIRKYFWFSITPFNSLSVEVLPAQGLAFLTWPSGTY